MKAPTKIGIPPGLRVLYIERHEANHEFNHEYGYMENELGFYKLWLHTADHILGTFLKLYDDGKIERVTVRDNEGDQIDLIKPPD